MGTDYSHEADTIEPKDDSTKMHMTKRAKKLLIVIITVGILLSLLAFGIALYVEQRYIHADFEHAAERALRTINGSLESIHYDLLNIGAFYEGSITVERHEFRSFTQHCLDLRQDIQGFKWIPLVPHALRAEYEAAAREDGFTDFQITERKEQGKMIPAATREEYFPVYYVEPYEGNEIALGYDLASDPARLKALNLSRDTGRIIASERITLVQETEDKFGFLIFQPIYHRGTKTDTVENRRANLKGFVLAVFKADDILAEALSQLKPQGLNIYLHDLTAPSGEQFLAYHSLRLRTETNTPINLENPDVPKDMHQEATIEIGAREWRVLCAATPQFIAARKTWRPWMALAAGLLLTGLLSAYARLLLAHNIKTKEFALAQVNAEENLSKEIEERKWAEDALMQSEAQKQAILDGITATIVFLDKNLEILWANKAFAEFVGTPVSKLTGHRCHEFIGDPNKLCPGCPTIKAFNGEKAEPLKMQTSEGTILELHSSPIFDREGKMIGVVEVGRDITEKAMLQRQLDQAHKMEAIGTLASGIAHEINTPTQYVGDNVRFLLDAFNNINNVVDKYSELLQACEAETATESLVEDVKKLIEEVDLEFLREEVPKATSQSLEGIERVTTIVRAMKDFAHPGPEEKVPIDLNKAIGSTVTVARNEWKYVSEVVTEFDPELPAVPCLAGEFNQVILNLIVNAAHAIADVVGDSGTEKGTITISTMVDGDFVEVRVKDTGKGIPEDIAPRIFDPFFTTKTVGKGSGQGLAIAHDVIADKLGGSITFESEVGKGSTFIIRLPLADSTSENENGPDQSAGSTDEFSVSEGTAVPELIG